jgi:hypothetical protein
MRLSRLSALILVALLVVAPLGLTVAAGPALAQSEGSAADGTATPTAGSGAVDNATSAARDAASDLANSSQPTGGATLAQASRVTAVQFDRDYLRTTRRADDSFNTTGPYAVFTSSRPLAAARITQPNADASVLDGSHTVHVSYAADAAGESGASLYELELFYEDGSTRTVDLYATRTDQYVASTDVRAAEDFLETMSEDAEEHGFETDIEGISAYHEWEKERADLFDNLFGPQFQALFAWLIVTVSTPFAIILLSIVVILSVIGLLRTHGWKLRSQQHGADTVEQRRRELHHAYQEDRTAADEERLQDIPEIGKHNEVFWKDGLGISTVKQLADAFAFGQVARDSEGNIVRDESAEPLTNADGEVRRWPNGDPVYPPVLRHRGIEDLEAANSLEDTWLEPMLRPDMLGDPASTLAHAKWALKRMTSHHGLAAYQGSRQRVAEMLNHLSDSRATKWETFGGSGSEYEERHSTSTSTTRSTGRDFGAGPGGAAGGDD